MAYRRADVAEVCVFIPGVQLSMADRRAGVPEVCVFIPEVWRSMADGVPYVA